MNLEWAVQPPGSSRAEMPVNRAAKIGIPSDLNRETMILSVNVLPVPAGASTMKGCGCPCLTALIAVVYVYAMSFVSEERFAGYIA